MTKPAVKVEERIERRPAERAPDPDELTQGLAGLLPGVGLAAGDPVAMPVPGVRVVQDEEGWSGMLSDPDPAIRAKRQGLLEHVRAMLELNRYAKEKRLSLKDAAKERAASYQEALETAWVTLREQNRSRRQAVEWAAKTLSNMQSSRARFRNKIFAVDASAKELASDAGLEFVAGELSKYVRRPDPRKSRAFLVAQGWAGSPTRLKKLARVTDEHRCILVTDAPAYDSLEKLRVAATEGALLESLAGEEMYHRHTVLVGNQGLVSRRFRGRYAEEKEDLYVPLSGPFFGLYLDNIARGKPWKPTVGYQNPIPGMAGVKLDLLLMADDEFDLYLRHRINPAILLSEGSDQVVVFGPDTLSKAGNGVQIGVAVVEMILVRYAEWIVNQYGLLQDLEEGEEVVRKKLSQFMVLNSGAGRMFRAGSRVSVTADHEKKALNITFELYFRELAEKAVIQISKPAKKEQVGAVSAA